MKKLFKPESLNTLLFVFVLFVFVKILWFVVEMLFLPANGVNYVEAKNIKGLYYRVKLVNEKKEKKTVKKPPVRHNINRENENIKAISLIAIYHSLDITVVTVEYKKKSKVLSKGDSINGFKLESATNNIATFSKNAKTYQLVLVKIDTKSVASIVSRPVTKKTVVKKSRKSSAQGKIEKVGDHRVVDRSLVDHYSKNLKEISKDIGIVDVRKGSDLTGFRISFVRRGSKFAQLGLRRGDIITSVNGQGMNSYGAALGIYKDVNTMENLSLVIKRNHEEMELEYEIN